jgi:hypothetical protein
MCNENLKLPSPISLEYIPYLWQQSDILIFLIDLDNYDIFSTSYLNRIELESLERLQTSHFKKRYIISRTVLKHILCNITNERSTSEISTYNHIPKALQPLQYQMSKSVLISNLREIWLLKVIWKTCVQNLQPWMSP